MNPPSPNPFGQSGKAPSRSGKLSEVLLDFVHHIVSEDADPDTLKAGLGLGVALWNLALFPEDQQHDALQEVYKVMGCQQHPSVKAEIERLLILRKQRYGHDRRIVLSYDLVKQGKGTRLVVMSAFMGPEEQRQDRP